MIFKYCVFDLLSAWLRENTSAHNIIWDDANYIDVCVIILLLCTNYLIWYSYSNHMSPMHAICSSCHCLTQTSNESHYYTIIVYYTLFVPWCSIAMMTSSSGTRISQRNSAHSSDLYHPLESRMKVETSPLFTSQLPSLRLRRGYISNAKFMQVRNHYWIKYRDWCHSNEVLLLILCTV